jgi:hypothetical protein
MAHWRMSATAWCQDAPRPSLSQPPGQQDAGNSCSMPQGQHRYNPPHWQPVPAQGHQFSFPIRTFPLGERNCVHRCLQDTKTETPSNIAAVNVHCPLSLCSPACAPVPHLAACLAQRPPELLQVLGHELRQLHQGGAGHHVAAALVLLPAHSVGARERGVGVSQSNAFDVRNAGRWSVRCSQGRRTASQCAVRGCDLMCCTSAVAREVRPKTQQVTAGHYSSLRLSSHAPLQPPPPHLSRQLNSSVNTADCCGLRPSTFQRCSTSAMLPSISSSLL